MVTALVFTLPSGTAGPKDKLYPWEKKHKSPATTTDAVLCYGASHHRNPFLWDKGRFAPYVTYVDPDGKDGYSTASSSWNRRMSTAPTAAPTRL